MNESDTVTEEEIPEIQLEIVRVIQATGAEEGTQLEIIDSLKEFTGKIAEWKTKAEGISVTSIEQKDDMKLAKDSRLGLRQVRLAMTNSLKDLKADALKRCQGIDAVTRFIKEEIEPLEKSLKVHEDFEKRYIEEERVKRAQLRAGQLSMYGATPAHYNLADMGADDFAVVLQEAKDAKAARDQRAAAEKAAAEKKAEDERIEAERLEKENARLRAEQEERDAKHKVTLARQTEMGAVNATRTYEQLAEMDDEQYAKALADAKAAAEAAAKAKAKEAAEREEEEQVRKKAHRKVLSRQMAMEHVKGLFSYDTLAAMDEDEFKSALDKATLDKAAADRKAAQQKKDADEAKALREKAAADKKAEDKRIAEKAAADKRQAEEEAAEAQKIQDAAITSHAKHAVLILENTADKWGERHPEVEGGKGLFIAESIRLLQVELADLNTIKG